MDNIPMNDYVFKRRKAAERRQGLQRVFLRLAFIVLLLIVLIIVGFFLKIL